MVNQVGNGAPEPNKAPPRFSVLTQYTKDFSFENPNAPRTLATQQQSPKISLQINVNARQLGPGDFEVSLMLEGGAGEGAEALFKFEINYAGVFRVENVPQEQIQPLVMIEGPRLLFPFARQIVAEFRSVGRLSAAVRRSDRFSWALHATPGRRDGGRGCCTGLIRKRIRADAGRCGKKQAQLAGDVTSAAATVMAEVRP